MERAPPAAGGWPSSSGAWLDAALNGELVAGLPPRAGARVLARGVEMLEVEVAYQADTIGRFIKARQRGAHRAATVFHLCRCSANKCGTVAPAGAVVEHLDMWQVMGHSGVARERAKLICLAAVKGTQTPGGPGEAGPLDQEIAGLEETAEDPALEARLARLEGRAARDVPRQGTPKNAARPAGAIGERLAQEVADRAAAAAPARTGASRRRSRPASAVTTALLDRDDDDVEDGVESDTERLGGCDHYQGVSCKRDLFGWIARQRPDALLANGLGHLCSQFTQQLSAGEADLLAPGVTQFLYTVLFVAHPPRALWAAEGRVLRPPGLALDGTVRWEVIKTADLVMLRFKARSMGIRDGNWQSARWLTLDSQEQLPSGTSLGEENAAEKVEARELKVAELRQRLADRRTSCSPTRSDQLLSDFEGDLDAAAAARVPPADAATGRGFTQHKDSPGSGVRTDAAEAAASRTPPPALRPPERQLRGSSQPRRWRQMPAEVGTGVSSKFRLPLAVHEAVRGLPGAIGRYGCEMCTSPDPTASFARLREVLPLPLPDAPLFERHRAAWYLHQQLSETCEVDAATAQVRALLVDFSLNYSYMGHMRCPTDAAVRPTAGLVSALGIVQEGCANFVQDPAAAFELPDWDQVIASKTVSHGGKVMSRAPPLSLAGNMPGLPAQGDPASVKAVDLADAQAGAGRAGPTLALLPRDESPAEVPQAAIQVASKQEWYRIGTKLVKLGLAAPIADDRILKVGSRRVLAGAFRVAQGGTRSPGQACVQRLIINMVSADSYQRVMEDGIGTLSASPSGVAVPLPEGHMLLGSSDDLASAFYGCELPEAWQPHMALAEAIPNELIGVPGPGTTHLALLVFPLGWIIADSEFQHCHRRLGGGGRPLASGFPADLEWHRDHQHPIKSKELEQQWVQYCIDDWDHGEGVPSALVAELIGTVSCAPEKQRAAYGGSGTSDAPGKVKRRALVLVQMGAGLDGAVGQVGVTAEKLHRTLALILCGMGRQGLSTQGMLMVQGRCVRAAEFRRPSMGFLNSVGAAGCWTRPQADPLGMCDELLGFAKALPLAYTDLRAKIVICDIATDASERAGDICHTAGLSAQGVACARGGASAVTLRPGAVAAPVRGARWRPRFVLIELYAGGAGAAVEASRLPIDMIAPVSCEVEPAAWRLVRRRLAGVTKLGNVEAVDTVRFTEMLKGYARDADRVVLSAGSPSQDLASINVAGTDLEGSRPKLFFTVPELTQAAEVACPERSVVFVENVSSMTLESRAEFSRALGVTPVFLGPRCHAHVKRPRLYWCSWPVTAFTAFDVTDETKGVREAASFEVLLVVERLPLNTLVLEGWSTLDPEADLPCFTRPIPGRHPPFRPVGPDCASVLAAGRWAADSYRYQVDNYGDGSLIWDARRQRGQLPVPEASWNVFPDFQQPGLRWQRPGHISALELEAAVAGARWRCRAGESHRWRCLPFLDAQPFTAVSTRGRSSVRALQPALRQLNSLLHATARYPLYKYCDTVDMPADTPPRWGFGRRCPAASAAAGESQESRPWQAGSASTSKGEPGHGPGDGATSGSKVPAAEGALDTPLTLRRHRAAVEEVVVFWIQEHGQPQTPAQVDAGVAAFIGSRWLCGESLVELNNAIPGIMHAFPPVRGHLWDSWRWPNGSAWSQLGARCRSVLQQRSQVHWRPWASVALRRCWQQATTLTSGKGVDLARVV
ncbi:unnamed protein product [Prorocentrum cordatum]|uniref:Uncharacterized protein n=1 Tax=Prorocentrum cordatum TaxID=2364126 RepID=A0ABN9X7F0_9DINO|nr:unnamed protein product [Polarella glacialis]